MAQDVVRFESLFSAPAEKSAAPTTATSAPLPVRPGHEAPPRVDPGAPAVMKDSYQDLERKYRHRTYQAQELMVEKLLRGHLVQSEALERKLNMFDLHFEGQQFMVVLVRPEGEENSFADYASDIRDGGQVGLIVSSIFSELLGEHYGCYPSNLDDRYAFLLNFTSEDEAAVSADVAAICRDAVKFIQDNFCLSLRVCVSGMSQGLYSLHESFRETDIVSGDRNTVYVDGVGVRAEGGKIAGGRRPEPSIEKQYLNALVTQDFQTALELTLERVHTLYMEDGKPDLGRVKMFLNMRLHTTGNVLAAPMDGMGEDGKKLGDDVMHLDHCNTIEDVEKSLTRIFGKLDSHFNSRAHRLYRYHRQGHPSHQQKVYGAGSVCGNDLRLSGQIPELSEPNVQGKHRHEPFGLSPYHPADRGEKAAERNGSWHFRDCLQGGLLFRLDPSPGI